MCNSYPSEMNIDICIFIDSGCFNDGEGVDVILRLFNKVIELFRHKEQFQTVYFLSAGDLSEKKIAKP